MRFVLKSSLGENVYNLMRKIGYFFQREDKEKKEFIFTRPPKGYPRFHLYLKIKNENLIFNLHLDQKKPIYPVRSPSRNDLDGRRLWHLASNGVYKGVPAHSGEYEGEIVGKEAERIKEILENAKN